LLVFFFYVVFNVTLVFEEKSFFAILFFFFYLELLKLIEGIKFLGLIEWSFIFFRFISKFWWFNVLLYIIIMGRFRCIVLVIKLLNLINIIIIIIFIKSYCLFNLVFVIRRNISFRFTK